MILSALANQQKNSFYAIPYLCSIELVQNAFESEEIFRYKTAAGCSLLTAPVQQSSEPRFWLAQDDYGSERMPSQHSLHDRARRR
jgi:hypothetical protein